MAYNRFFDPVQDVVSRAIQSMPSTVNVLQQSSTTPSYSQAGSSLGQEVESITPKKPTAAVF